VPIFFDDDVVIVTSSANRTLYICVLFSPPVMYQTHKSQTT